jgi:uncharacterized SAM-binding protein YcdF (DUF218 family)
LVICILCFDIAWDLALGIWDFLFSCPLIGAFILRPLRDALCATISANHNK